MQLTIDLPASLATPAMIRCVLLLIAHKIIGLSVTNVKQVKEATMETSWEDCAFPKGQDGTWARIGK